jgi:hypothetical protein
MLLQIAPLIALERRRPVLDRVLFAVGRAPQLVLAGNNCTALSYAPLSDFLASMAELRMGKGIEPAEQAQCLPNCKHKILKRHQRQHCLESKGSDLIVQEFGTGVCFYKRTTTLSLL